MKKEEIELNRWYKEEYSHLHITSYFYPKYFKDFLGDELPWGIEVQVYFDAEGEDWQTSNGDCYSVTISENTHTYMFEQVSEYDSVPEKVDIEEAWKFLKCNVTNIFNRNKNAFNIDSIEEEE